MPLASVASADRFEGPLVGVMPSSAPDSKAKFKGSASGRSSDRANEITLLSEDRPDIIAKLQLDPHHDTRHGDFLHVVEYALPLIEAARNV